MCSAMHDPTALDGFPLYWTEHPNLLRAKALDELSPADREVCKALAGLGIVFDTLKLIASEYNAHALTTYFGRETLPLPSFVICTFPMASSTCFPLYHVTRVSRIYAFCGFV